MQLLRYSLPDARDDARNDAQGRAVMTLLVELERAVMTLLAELDRGALHGSAIATVMSETQ